MEYWSIDVAKDYLKFSAAHFLIFPDGSAERLHGHNYRVYTEIQAVLTRFGLVVDFVRIKPLVRELVDELDERWLIPGEHHELTHQRREDGVVEVRYRDRYYAAPEEDVLVLPISNTSAENLAGYLGRRLIERLGETMGDIRVDRLHFAVEETPGQRAIYHYEREPSEGEAAS